ncbi:DUF6128 domain-containing protein [Murimonas intestini]|uniref:DUF6128 domain-containing protein n=1 Tax=Murimonas intestini TaxID=1337051 RepID=UPI0011DDA762|nr:DUF6128 domain-containing protein [Murimonas intestini]
MAEYRRFVAYVYGYREGRKDAGAGFAKIESRNGECRMRIHLRDTQEDDGICKVYGVIREGEWLPGVYLGMMPVSGGSAEKKFVTDSDKIGGSEYSLRDLVGLWIQKEGGGMYAAFWVDEPLDVSKLVEEVPDSQSGMTDLPDPTGAGGEGRETEEAAEDEETHKVSGDAVPEGDAAENIGAADGADAAEIIIGSEDVIEAADTAGAEKSTDAEESIGAAEATEAADAAGAEETTGAADAIGAADTTGAVENINAEETAGADETIDAADPADILDPTETIHGAEAIETADTSDETDRSDIEDPADAAGTRIREPEMSGGKLPGDGVPAEGTCTEQADTPEGAAGAYEEEAYSAGDGSSDGLSEEGNCPDKEPAVAAQEAAEALVMGRRSATNAGTGRSGGIQRRGQQGGTPGGMQRGNMQQRANMQRRGGQQPLPAPSLEQRWGQLLQRYPSIQPFGDDEVIECIRICPDDIKYLRQNHWNLGKNSFLLHGYYNYRHLIMGRLKKGGYILGIPGVFDNQERYMANMFGFTLFKKADRERRRPGFGYWCRLVD